jgi:uncharacterized protein
MTLSTVASRSPLRTIAFAAFVATSWLTPASAEDVAPPPAAATAPVPVAVDPAALAAAKDLMEVTGAAKNFDNMVAMLKKHVMTSAGDGTAAQAMAETFDKAMSKIGSYKQQMMDEMAVLHANKFTAAELKAVTEFYKSGPGAKFVTVMPELMQEGGAIGQKYAVQMMKDLKEAKDAPKAQ